MHKISTSVRWDKNVSVWGWNGIFSYFIGFLSQNSDTLFALTKMSLFWEEENCAKKVLIFFKHNVWAEKNSFFIIFEKLCYAGLDFLANVGPDFREFIQEWQPPFRSPVRYTSDTFHNTIFEDLHFLILVFFLLFNFLFSISFF